MILSKCQLSPACPDIQPIHIETQGIYTLLYELDLHKASGPDGIPTRLLKELAYSVATVLALIFNASLKGSRTDPVNYRPISLTCVCCKVFEHIISSAISNHANIYNIICTEQHGFRKHRSCETQLLETINDIAMSLNRYKLIYYFWTSQKP